MAKLKNVVKRNGKTYKKKSTVTNFKNRAVKTRAKIKDMLQKKSRTSNRIVKRKSSSRKA